ncbi:hypothetical protein PLESTF_000006900 [Pleodorina starrii]|nr:hypothetical protein PLESTF_000006900 [Pleodorina starrii]
MTANLAAVSRAQVEPSPPNPAPSPTGTGRGFVKFSNLSAHGVSDASTPLIWYDGADFREQLAPKSALQLISRGKPDCPRKCAICDLAWKVERNNLQVALFFRDPVQLSHIFIKQVKNSGVSKVQLIKWTYPPQGRIDGLLGRSVLNVSEDGTVCLAVQTVRIPPKKSGINRPVPADGSREALPPQLTLSAVGGVLITMKQAPNAGDIYGPFVEYVRFSGRVLYPSDPSLYLRTAAQR